VDAKNGVRCKIRSSTCPSSSAIVRETLTKERESEDSHGVVSSIVSGSEEELVRRSAHEIPLQTPPQIWLVSPFSLSLSLFVRISKTLVLLIRENRYGFC